MRSEIGAWVRTNTENSSIHFFRKSADAVSEKIEKLGVLEFAPICGVDIKLKPFAEVLVGHNDASDVNCPDCQKLLKG
jgi:hypothetical protein